MLRRLIFVTPLRSDSALRTNQPYALRRITEAPGPERVPAGRRSLSLPLPRRAEEARSPWAAPEPTARKQECLCFERFLLHNLLIGPAVGLLPVHAGTLDGQVEISSG